MKAAVLYEQQRPLVIEELTLEGPRLGEVLVKMAASGVCHSDLLFINGSWQHPLPVVLGHEGSGIVEDVGPGVTYAKRGDHVVLYGVPSCGQCSYCVNGEPYLCGTLWELKGNLLDGTKRFRRGRQEVHHFNALSTFGEYAVVPEESVVVIRDDAPLDKVCLVGCGVMTGVGAAIRTAKVRPGSRVVIIGAGGVGLNVVQGAALAGAGAIIAVDVRGPKLEHALGFGATHTINASAEDVESCVRDITRGEMADYAFEVVGSEDTINQALHTTRRGGTTVVVGLTPGGSSLTLDSGFLLQGRSLIGSFYGSSYHRADMPKFVDLYMAGKLKLDELISHTFTLDEINAAFQILKSGEGIRSIIRYG